CEHLPLEPRVRLLVGVDLPLRGLELLLVADAAQTHPSVLDLALLLQEQRLELAPPHLSGRRIVADPLDRGAPALDGGVQLRRLALELDDLELALAVLPIDFLK